MWVQKAVTKRWDRYGTIFERYENAWRYLIKLESGMIIRRNRIHLRKRFIDCDFIVTDFYSATDSTTVTSNVPQNVALPDGLIENAGP